MNKISGGEPLGAASARRMALIMVAKRSSVMSSTPSVVFGCDGIWGSASDVAWELWSFLGTSISWAFDEKSNSASATPSECTDSFSEFTGPMISVPRRRALQLWHFWNVRAAEITYSMS